MVGREHWPPFQSIPGWDGKTAVGFWGFRNNSIIQGPYYWLSVLHAAVKSVSRMWPVSLSLSWLCSAMWIVTAQTNSLRHFKITCKHYIVSSLLRTELEEQNHSLAVVSCSLRCNMALLQDTSKAWFKRHKTVILVYCVEDSKHIVRVKVTCWQRTGGYLGVKQCLFCLFFFKLSFIMYKTVFF